MTLMHSADFCIWLKTLLDNGKDVPTPEEVALIRQHLSEVFLHEIDPAMGDAAHQKALNQIHRNGVH
jgi:hypothetical protein